MSATAQRYKYLYDEGRVSLKGLQNAVVRGLITEAEFEEITQEVQP